MNKFGALVLLWLVISVGASYLLFEREGVDPPDVTLVVVIPLAFLVIAALVSEDRASRRLPTRSPSAKNFEKASGRERAGAYKPASIPVGSNDGSTSARS